MAPTTSMAAIRRRRFLLPTIMVLLALAGMAAIVGTRASTASATGVVHGEIVPERPRNDVPIVLDGEVRAHAKVGDRVFVGGDFQQVQLIDGTTITQPYIFAYDINTGVLDQGFRPVLNKPVKALEATETDDGVFVGGQFSRWETPGSTSFPLRIAKLTADGSLDPAFSASASAQVLSIDQVGGDVYIGGNFLNASGTAASGLAKLDAVTGAIDTSFVFVLGDSVNGSQLVRRVEATPDGQSLFVMHYGLTVNGQTRRAVAKMDLTGPSATLSGWTVPWLEQTNDSLCWTSLRDMAISPDGSFLVVGGQGADNPPNCDSVLKYSTAGDGVVPFSWSARMYSSVFSVAVSDVAVYVGGHFCGAPKNPIPPGGVSSDFTGTANLCVLSDPTDPSNPSERDPDNAVFRYQMAALDPTTGQALAWDPGSNNSVGVFDLTLIDRGLLAGHDSNRFNGFNTGRSGFFDFGIPDDIEAPTIVVTEPTAGTVISDATQLAGTAADNRGVTAVTIRLKNVTTGEWLQTDGSFGLDPADLAVTTIDIGLGELAWSTPVSDLPPGDYEVRGFAQDAVGNTSTPLASPFTVPGVTSCTVELDENDLPVITYTDFLENGVDTVNIRRDGSWLATAPAGSGTYTDASAAPGDYTYVVRWRPAAGTTDVTCTPAPITVPEGGGGVMCTVGLDANSSPVLSWTAIPGVNNYIVREATLGYVATVTDGGTTYTDAGRAPGDYSYTLRYRQGGTPIDVTCTPSPITVPDLGGGDTCTVAVNANGEVEVNWSEVIGEDTYIVRDNDGWVATVNNATSYVDASPTSGDRSYSIRYRMAGVTTDVPCDPDPVVVP